MSLGLRVGDAISNLIVSQMLQAQELEESEESGSRQPRRKLLDNKNIQSLNKNKNHGGDITAVLLGVMLVAGVATIASYQAIHVKDYSEQLSHGTIAKDTPSSESVVELYNSIRLPKLFKPESYILYTSVNLTLNRGYVGLVKIKMNCIKNTSAIVLHSTRHDILRVMVKTDDGVELNVSKVDHYHARERIVINTNETMYNGSSYSVLISFRHVLSLDESNGIYLSKYFLKDGRDGVMLSTMFEPTYARTAFPCFDEPAYKTPFTLIVMHNSSYTAHSNMPSSKSLYMSNGWTESHFQITPNMSSYLLAFMVTDYTYRESISVNGLPVRVFSTPDRTDETATALKFAPLFSDLFSYKFDITFPLPKLDLVPLRKLSAAGEETWGMMYFAESQLLVSSQERQNIAHMYRVLEVVAHEVAHQWFGDLVTMKWWNDLWLKESFATFLELIAINYYLPSWDMQSRFFLTTTASALSRDSFVTDHPITSKDAINMDAQDLSASYDMITYEKGAAVLQMLRSYLQDKDFFYGISVFLNQYKYQNADANDFFRIIGSAAKKDVLSFMSNWMYETGYPVVTASIKNGNLTLTQNRFLYTIPAVTDTPADNVIWQIPVEVKAFGLGTFSMFLGNKTVQRSVPQNMFTWFKCNWGAQGYYRVNYDEENWLLLKEQLLNNHKLIPSLDRANLLNDAMHLARGNHLNLDVALSLTKYLNAERSYAPWVVADGHLMYMKWMFHKTPLFKCFQTYILKKAQPTLDALVSSPYLSHEDRMLKPLLYGVATVSESEYYVLELRNAFLKWMFTDGKDDLPGDLRSIIYCTGVRYGGEDEFNFLWNKLQKTYASQKRMEIIGGLSCSYSSILLKRLLDLAQNSTYWHGDEQIRLYTATCSNYVGNSIAWKIVKEQWNHLYDRYEDSHVLLSYLLEGCLSYYKTNKELTEAQEFFKIAKLDGAARATTKLLTEVIQRNIDFVRRYDVAARNWFQTEDPECLKT